MPQAKPPQVPSTKPAQGSNEEPEIAQEEDIPSDDGEAPRADDAPVKEKRPLRHVERE